jgi:hypothetical protein
VADRGKTATLTLSTRSKRGADSQTFTITALGGYEATGHTGQENFSGTVNNAPMSLSGTGAGTGTGTGTVSETDAGASVSFTETGTVHGAGTATNTTVLTLTPSSACGG